MHIDAIVAISCLMLEKTCCVGSVTEACMSQCKSTVIHQRCIKLLSTASGKKALFHLMAKNDIAAGSKLIAAILH